VQEISGKSMSRENDAATFILELLRMSPLEVTRFTAWMAKELEQQKAKAAGA
jgi:hypothetical protein